MIEKIDFIRDFGIYKNYSWNTQQDIPPFKQKNILYGWNYSGKTTLSRVFSSLREKSIFPDYVDGDFKITLKEGSSYNKGNIGVFPHPVIVYNSDYIKENLSWEKDDEINTILFKVGEDAKRAKKIKELKNKIEQVEGTDSIKGRKEPFLDDIASFNDFEIHQFTEESRRIKNDIFSSIVDFTKRDFKRQLPLVIQNLSSFILKDIVVKKLSKTVKIEEPKPEINKVEIEFKLPELINETNDILSKTPKKNDVIAVLERNIEAVKWVKKGLELNNIGEDCLFCGNLITEERIILLNKYYENYGSKLREKAKEVLDKIVVEKDKIENLDFPKSIQDLNDGFQIEYKKSKSHFDKFSNQYLSKLKLLEKRLNQKITNKLYRKILEVSLYDTNKIEKQLNTLNKIIDLNNNFSMDFENLIKGERIKYINHLVAKYLKENNYLQKKSRRDKAIVKIESLDKKIAAFQTEIDRLEAKNDSGEEGGIQFEYFIKSFLGKDDIKIKYHSETKNYSLSRNGKLASNLSEGEKMAISFSHFLVTLKSFKDKDELKDYILFIDDPMSSLDGNHIFQINALLKDFLYEEITNPQNAKQMMRVQTCLQLFISTHNFEFFNLLKELPTIRGFNYKNYSTKKESRYFIQRNGDNSKIIKLPKVYDSFKSEYHYLFKVIYEFNEDPNNTTSDILMLMPNVLRRFLEIYTLAKYPSADEVDVRSDILFGKVASKRICKPFHYFSHFNNIDRIGRQSEFLADVTKASNELIKQVKKDTKHFKALQTVIS